jgi:G protein-coupled glucose receptor regulating Gpa2/G protein-coupled glucose receptor regulating Gpa2 C-term
VSIGDLASGAFCFFIGLHTFLAVVFNYKMSNWHFGLSIAGIWISVYALTIVGVAMHPEDIFVRAVSWCWMNSKYGNMRLWLHYFWIFTFEFGTVLIYIAMFVALQYRIKSNFYSGSTKQSEQARTAARLMIIYPIIYVICTLPLATLRMVSMASTTMPGFAWFCFAGAMITSNGWMDVCLYTLTRRIMLFSDEPPPDNGLETFSMPFSGAPLKRFGNRTTCEFTGESQRTSRVHSRWIGRHDTKSSAAASFTSTSQLFDPESSPRLSSYSPKLNNDAGFAVKTKTTVEVRSELLVRSEDMHELRTLKDQSEGISTLQSPSQPPDDSIEFATKPEGWPA